MAYAVRKKKTVVLLAVRIQEIQEGFGKGSAGRDALSGGGDAKAAQVAEVHSKLGLMLKSRPPRPLKGPCVWARAGQLWAPLIIAGRKAAGCPRRGYISQLAILVPTQVPK